MIILQLPYQGPNPIPIGHMSFGFSGRNAGFSVRCILEDPEDAFKALSWTAEMYQWSPMPFTPGHTVWEVLDFGGTARMPSGKYEGTLIMKTHLVETEKDKDILFGNLDPNLLQIDTLHGIYDRCREIIREGSKVPGGFMLAPGCSIPATAPPVNVYALTRAARDFSAT